MAAKQNSLLVAALSSADWAVRGRWELAHKRAIRGWGPRCMLACSGEVRSTIRSVIEQLRCESRKCCDKQEARRPK